MSELAPKSNQNSSSQDLVLDVQNTKYSAETSKAISGYQFQDKAGHAVIDDDILKSHAHLLTDTSQNKNDEDGTAPDRKFPLSSESTSVDPRHRYEGALNYATPTSATPAFPYQWRSSQDRIEANRAVHSLDDTPVAYSKHSINAADADMEPPLSGRSSSLYSTAYNSKVSLLDLNALSSRVSSATTADPSATIEERIKMMSRVLEDIKQEGSSVDTALLERHQMVDYENGYTRYLSRIPSVYGSLNVERIRLKTLNDLLETAPSLTRLQHLDMPTWLPAYTDSMESPARRAAVSRHGSSTDTPSLLGRPAWGGDYGTYGGGVSDSRRITSRDWSSNKAVGLSHSNPNVISTRSGSFRPRLTYKSSQYSHVVPKVKYKPSQYSHVAPKVSSFRSGPSAWTIGSQTMSIFKRSRSYDHSTNSNRSPWIETSSFTRIFESDLNWNKQSTLKTSSEIAQNGKITKIPSTSLLSKQADKAAETLLHFSSEPNHSSSRMSNSRESVQGCKQTVTLAAQGPPDRKKQTKFKPYIPIRSKDDLNMNAKQYVEDCVDEQAMWDRVDRIFDQVIDGGAEQELHSLCTRRKKTNVSNPTDDHLVNERNYGCLTSAYNAQCKKRMDCKDNANGHKKYEQTHIDTKTDTSICDRNQTSTSFDKTPKSPAIKQCHHLQQCQNQMNEPQSFHDEQKELHEPVIIEENSKLDENSNQLRMSEIIMEAMSLGQQVYLDTKISKDLRNMSAIQDRLIPLILASKKMHGDIGQDKKSSDSSKRRMTCHIYNEIDKPTKDTIAKATYIWSTRIDGSSVCSSTISDQDIRRMVGLLGEESENNLPGWRTKKRCTRIGDGFFSIPLVRGLRCSNKSYKKEAKKKKSKISEDNSNEWIHGSVRSLHGVNGSVKQKKSSHSSINSSNNRRKTNIDIKANSLLFLMMGT